jgi:mutator family transposase
MYCSASSTFLPILPRLPRGLILLLLLSVLWQTGLPPNVRALPVLPALTIAAAPWPRGRLHLQRVKPRRSGRPRWGQLFMQLLVRTSFLALLLQASGWVARTPLTAGLLLLPLFQTLALVWGLARPTSAHVLWRHGWTRWLQRLYQLLFLLLLVSTLLPLLPHRPPPAWGVGGSLVLSTQVQPAPAEPEIQIETPAENQYTVTLRGTLTFEWTARDSFERWMLILFLRRFRRPGKPRPFVRPPQIKAAFGVGPATLCRHAQAVEADGWHILSDRYRHQIHSRLPDAELSRQILQVWVPAFWLSAWDVRERLIQLGILANRDVLEVDALHTLAHHTGFAQVREVLLERFDLQAGQLIAKESWWLQNLIALNERLLAKLERGEQLTPQERVDLEPWRLNPSAKTTDSAPPPLAAALHRALFQPPAEPAAPPAPVRCTYCDRDQVAPKSKQPRLKTLRDEFGHAHVIQVLRYYCHNPACRFQSFTHFPTGVLPHSPYPVQVRVLAVEVYVALLSTDASGPWRYRRGARMLDVPASTVYGWLVSVSPSALCLAAYLGVVRTSGVVGLDDKCPKGRPRSRIKVCSPSAVPKHGRRPRAVWRYVYFAVDAYSYDLLALELYPEHNDAAVRLFLLELKAKGLRPRVVVTDLDPAYSRMLPLVFPQAVHHECIFHAIQNALHQMTKVYGRYYLEKIPETLLLHEALTQLFQARTQKTVRQRFAELMALRSGYVTRTPEVACVFDSLENHFPKLINAIESRLIPRTNNATELVIRRFDQHYQGMCGLDSFASAQVYLRLFELVYRLTPFMDDNPGAKRGKSPLELAGYDLQALPIADFFLNLKLPPLSLPTETLSQ